MYGEYPISKCLMFSPAKRHGRAHTHTVCLEVHLCVCVCGELTLSKTLYASVCVCCALCLSWDRLIRSTLTAITATNQGDQKTTADEEKRKCSFIHSLPTGIYQLRVCLRSHLSVFVFSFPFFLPDVTPCACVCVV